MANFASLNMHDAILGLNGVSLAAAGQYEIEMQSGDTLVIAASSFELVRA